MSEYAREVSTGLEMTATGFRSLYLVEGDTFEDFICPFCEVKLKGKNLYRDEIVKRPYFSLFPGGSHLFNCNGYPIGAAPTKRNAATSKLLSTYTFLPRDLWFPEELLPERPKKGPGSLRKAPRATLSEAEVDKRRRSVDPSIIATGAFKAPTVRAFADTWRIIVASCLKHAKMTGQDSNKLIDNVLSGIPLSLPGNKNTTYREGIRTTMFLLDEPCIYRGKGGVVEEDSRFILLSDKKTRIRPGNRDVESWVIIPKPGAGVKLSKPQELVYSQIKALAAEPQKECKWFAFGTMYQHENGKTTCQLLIDNLDWLHVALI